MGKTRKSKRNNKRKKKTTPVPLFVLFITVAVLTIVLLEYIDFRRGGKSFIFTRLVPLKPTVSGKVATFNGKLSTILEKNRIPHDYFLDDENKYHFKLEINQGRFGSLIDRIESILGKLGGDLELTEIQGYSSKSVMLYTVRLDKKTTHLLLITKLKPPGGDSGKATGSTAARVTGKNAAKSAGKNTGKGTGSKPSVKKDKPSPASNQVRAVAPRGRGAGGSPRIAIIIDDIGAYDIGPLDLKQLGIPITGSVLPDSHRAREAVHWMGEYGLDVMIHLPMQPRKSRGKRVDPAKVVTLESTEAQIRALVRRARELMPGARGLNNHQGSLATANRPVMERLMRVLREEGLFFVDSRTISSTVAYATAAKMGLRAAHKDVFLDHVTTYKHSLFQVRRLVDIARQKGRAIAIGHPFESTMRAIRDSKEYIRQQGVEIVFVKELLN